MFWSKFWRIMAILGDQSEHLKDSPSFRWEIIKSIYNEK